MPQTVRVDIATIRDRVKKILTTPTTEWPVIAAESTDVEKLYREYIAVLAAIPAVGYFIGTTIFGTAVVAGFANMIVSYVLSLVGVYVAAVVIDRLAPTFQSTPSTIQALKLVAYASTPTWVAGVLYIIPPLSVLGVLAALYGIYLFYLGLPVLMKTPDAKVIPYMLVSAVIVIAIWILIAIVSAVMTGVSGVVML